MIAYKALEDEMSLSEWNPQNPQRHIYSRATQNVTSRVETVIGNLHVCEAYFIYISRWLDIKDGFAITFASGLSAVYVALVHLKPRRIAIDEGFHGTHSTIDVYQQSREVPVEVIGLDDEYQKGDIVWLETPLNPTGEARDIQHYAEKVLWLVISNMFEFIHDCNIRYTK